MNQGEKSKPMTWTVSEAKARLSEVLRLASENPQYIGAKGTHVIVLAEEWEKKQDEPVSMGKWLINALRCNEELVLPERDKTEREVPFSE